MCIRDRNSTYADGLNRFEMIFPNEVFDVNQMSEIVMVLAKVSTITERKKALQLIKELCYLANSDRGLDDEEIDFIIDMAPIQIKSKQAGLYES